MRDGDGHVLLGDHVDGDLVHRVQDHRAPRVAVVVADFLQLVGQDLVDAAGLGQDVLEVGDRDPELLELVHHLLPLQAGQALELHLQDGVGLDHGEGELRD